MRNSWTTQAPATSGCLRREGNGRTVPTACHVPAPAPPDSDGPAHKRSALFRQLSKKSKHLTDVRDMTRIAARIDMGERISTGCIASSRSTPHAKRRWPENADQEDNEGRKRVTEQSRAGDSGGGALTLADVSSAGLAPGTPSWRCTLCSRWRPAFSPEDKLASTDTALPGRGPQGPTRPP